MPKKNSKDTDLSKEKEKKYCTEIIDELNPPSLGQSRSRSDDSDLSKKKLKIAPYKFNLRLIKYCQLNGETHPEYEASIPPYLFPQSLFEEGE